MKKEISVIASVVVTITLFPRIEINAVSNTETKWEHFLKYDLCISDYDSLSAEDQQLCHFIYDTEQAANDDIICERARRTLAGDKNLGERITLDQLDSAYGIWDNYADFKNEGWQTYIHCVPDVIHLQESDYNNKENYYSYSMYQRNEYWLDDDGETYVVFTPKHYKEEISKFDVYDESGELLQSIPAAANNIPYLDYRTTEESLKEFGCIEKNGGYYYIKTDGTAVFAWSIYSNKLDSSPVTEPFVIESEINGFPVTAIENCALAGSPLTEVILPDSIEIIDAYAFHGSPYLQKFNIPKNVKYIGYLAFSECRSLETISIDCPELNISRNAFSACYNLKKAKLKVKNLGVETFSFCKNLESVNLENGIEVIRRETFSSCINLNEVKIPDSVKYIEQGAFNNRFNSSVKSVIIPSSVCLIGTYPRKTGIVQTSGLEPPKPLRPLTDEPICAFSSDCVIYGNKGTEAERYAKEWELEFVPQNEIKGDANCDVKVNIADAVLVMQVATNPDKYAQGKSDVSITAQGEINADVDGKAGLTNEDALMIQKYKLGLINKL